MGSLPSATITACSACTTGLRIGARFFGIAQYIPTRAKVVKTISAALFVGFIGGVLRGAVSRLAKYMPGRRSTHSHDSVDNSRTLRRAGRGQKRRAAGMPAAFRRATSRAMLVVAVARAGNATAESWQPAPDSSSVARVSRLGPPRHGRQLRLRTVPQFRRAARG